MNKMRTSQAREPKQRVSHPSIPLLPEIEALVAAAESHPDALAWSCGVLGQYAWACQLEGLRQHPECITQAMLVAREAARWELVAWSVARSLAVPTRESEAGLRRHLYAAGVIRPRHRRETVAERTAREAAAWGYARKAVA